MSVVAQQSKRPDLLGGILSDEFFKYIICSPYNPEGQLYSQCINEGAESTISWATNSLKIIGVRDKSILCTVFSIVIWLFKVKDKVPKVFVSPRLKRNCSGKSKKNN